MHPLEQPQDGRAFEFATTGREVGRITSTDATAAPFTTTATGVATALNADRVSTAVKAPRAPRRATPGPYVVSVAGNDPKKVVVDQPDAADQRTGFHLQVVC